MINYVKANIHNKNDLVVNKFVYEQGNDPFLIEVPEEFKDVEPQHNYEVRADGGRIYKRRPAFRKTS